MIGNVLNSLTVNAHAAGRHYAACHVQLTPREAAHRAALLTEARAALPPEDVTLEIIAGAHLSL